MRSILTILALCQLCSTAEADDDLLARKLIREARTICGEDCQYLAQFGAAYARIGDHEAAKKAFADAHHAAARLEDTIERRLVLDGIARLQTQSGQAEEASAAAQGLPARYEQGMLLGSIAAEQAEAGDLSAALQTVNLIPQDETWHRNSALVLIAMSMSQRHDFASATRVLNLTSSDVEAASRILAEQVAGDALGAKEQEIVNQAMAMCSVFVVIAEDQAKNGELQAALQTATGIGLELHRAAALRRVASVAAETDDIAIARAAINDIRDLEQRDLALAALIAALAKQGHFQEAGNLVDTLSDPAAKAAALFKMATAHATHGDVEAVHALFQRAKTVNPTDHDAIGAAAKQIVVAYLQSSHLELAERFTSEIDDPAVLSEALQEIAAATAAIKTSDDAQPLFDKSQEIAQSIPDPYGRSARLRELAVARFKAGDVQEAESTLTLALAAARDMEPGGGTDVIELTEIATTQRSIGDRTGAAASFEVARQAATRYPDQSYIAELLHDVAFAQARAGDVESAIQAARQQESTLNRSRMLLAVANAILSEQGALPERLP